ncbi:MAG TPA: methyltransferase domain-containing protein [bacterium]|nr:methyltransferase domain-containing protein [bacterium]
MSKSLPTSLEKSAAIAEVAAKHIRVFNKHTARPLGEATFYEFGTGWDLLIPLTFYSLGANKQVLVDIRNLLRPKIIDDTIDKLGRLQDSLSLNRTPNRIAKNAASLPSSLKTSFGIDYRAPCDARRTGLEAGTIDFVTSTNTLEHIPEADIRGILRECHRLLRDDGIMSFQIDYLDHYSYFDGGISGYNFLRYSEKQWRRYNPSLHYQNRLRHKDHLQLIRDAGFEIVEEERDDGTQMHLKTIEELPVDKRFELYSPTELAVRSSWLVIRKSNRRG